MSKVIRGTLVGLAVAAIAAPLAQADAFKAPSDRGRLAERNDVSRLLAQQRLNPWKVGSLPARMHPWASRDKIGY